jgi:hypothetical protein
MKLELNSIYVQGSDKASLYQQAGALDFRELIWSGTRISQHSAAARKVRSADQRIN